MSEKPIRVLVVDDQSIVRKGIRALLAQSDDIDVVGEAADGAQAIEQAQTLQPDVILMDLVMPNVDGIEAIEAIASAREDARILVLTSFAGDDQVFPAIKAGALGYLLKDSEPDELLAAIRQTYNGEVSLHRTIAGKMLHEIREPAGGPLSPDPLTRREVDVIQLVARGMTNQEIAEQLTVTEATVRAHVSNILGKLHLANRVQATLYALKEGLASLDDEADAPQ